MLCLMAVLLIWKICCSVGTVLVSGNLYLPELPAAHPDDLA